MRRDDEILERMSQAVQKAHQDALACGPVLVAKDGWVMEKSQDGRERKVRQYAVG